MPNVRGPQARVKRLHATVVPSVALSSGSGQVSFGSSASSQEGDPTPKGVSEQGGDDVHRRGGGGGLSSVGRSSEARPPRDEDTRPPSRTGSRLIEDRSSSQGTSHSYGTWQARFNDGKKRYGGKIVDALGARVGTGAGSRSCDPSSHSGPHGSRGVRLVIGAHRQRGDGGVLVLQCARGRRSRNVPRRTSTGSGWSRSSDPTCQSAVLWTGCFANHGNGPADERGPGTRTGKVRSTPSFAPDNQKKKKRRRRWQRRRRRSATPVDPSSIFSSSIPFYR